MGALFPISQEHEIQHNGSCLTSQSHHSCTVVTRRARYRRRRATRPLTAARSWLAVVISLDALVVTVARVVPSRPLAVEAATFPLAGLLLQLDNTL